MQYLYRHYDKNNRLLYVGITSYPRNRLNQHLNKSHWQDEIDNIYIDRYRSRREVKQAEKLAIATERPLHNILMNGKRKRFRRKGKGLGWIWIALVAVLGAGVYIYIRHPVLVPDLLKISPSDLKGLFTRLLS